jgi:hypothetical protein
MRGAGFLVVALSAMACGLSRPPAPRQSEAMERSARMLKQLDRMEADLHQTDAEADTYAVLVERHGHAQEIACKVTDEHVAEIHRLDMLQQEKIAARRKERQQRKKKAVAQLAPRAAQTFAAR